ncbi:hypothetical protein [Vibrio crassostreae]|uniref:hypothetical protein n=1 Tax=Vibrio crassostreae TaxID=246167 RepID=UPI00104F1851|nr:hypothetical protein [Vibrio crassostreae]TCO00824.1 hypothetical protein EDB51_10813 [Vibrio crassostreae]CAK2007669.1 conserved hypothetical protein [Vibrio crassostreae]CAK2009477.1 conserved hypothetical protein [Vibrio crassostreae]CAK2017802.1 conserved hypothetical protein [Vibrio crassostreae]CAK2800713.1 conserved hypothetical protein [Vibrio crassostreae]
MSKLSNPSRNINQFVYDFSRYNYADQQIESKTIQRVKDITQNASSDDGIKEIQLELLWKGLNKSSEPTKAQRPIPKNEVKPKSKSALRKEKKAKKKQDAVVKAKLKSSNTSRRTLKPSSIKPNKDSWSNAPSWNEVKRKSQQNIDATSKMDLVDRLSSSKEVGTKKVEPSSLSTECKPDLGVSEALQKQLSIYGLKYSQLAGLSGDPALRVSYLDNSHDAIELTEPCFGSSLYTHKQVAFEEQLEVSLELFSEAPKYKNSAAQYAITFELHSFLWNAQFNRYKDLLSKFKIPTEKLLSNPFRNLELDELIDKQALWNEFDVYQKAYLLRELRYRLGYTKKRSELSESLIQPPLLEEFIQLINDDLVELDYEQHSADQAAKMNVYEEEHTSEDKGDNLISIQNTPIEGNIQKTLSNKLMADLKVFRWPSTIAFEADGSLPEVEWPKIGVLKAVGYTVGAQGLPQADRRTILTNVYIQSLPYVDSRSYMNEWGEPLSSDRLKKMAETLASLTKGAKRKTQANMKQAIRDWESDLAWLKEQYYLEHKYLWVWPRSGNKDESDRELTTKEKHYHSSREFLIEQYTNKANELCCQICQSALPFKLESGEYFWEEIPVTNSINSSPYSDLILCPNHRAMYLHTNSKPNQLLENLGDSFSKKLSIELASEKVSIFVTELHQKKLRLAKELMPRTKASSCLFDFSNIPQGLQGVKKLYLYENQGSWVVSSRAKVIATLTSKSEAKQWLAGFDEHRGVISTITEKVPTPKSMKTKQPKLKARSSLSVAAVRFGTVKKAEPQSSYKSGYSLCTTCNGDGGINGGCWKCGGSGWM